MSKSMHRSPKRQRVAVISNYMSQCIDELIERSSQTTPDIIYDRSKIEELTYKVEEVLEERLTLEQLAPIRDLFELLAGYVTADFIPTPILSSRDRDTPRFPGEDI